MNQYRSLSNNDRKHQYATYVTAAEAVAQGRNVDIVDEGRSYRLRVDGKVAQVSSRGTGTWQFTDWQRPVAEDTDVVAFADFTDDAPDYYVVPAQWFREEVHQHHTAWLKQVGSRPRNPDGTHHDVALDRIEQWQHRWDIFN